MITNKKISEICEQYLSKKTKVKNYLHEQAEYSPIYNIRDFLTMAKEQLSEKYILNNIPYCLIDYEHFTKSNSQNAEYYYTFSLMFGIDQSWLFTLHGYLGPVSVIKKSQPNNQLDSSDITYEVLDSKLIANVSDKIEIPNTLFAELKIKLPSGKIINDEESLNKIVTTTVQKYFKLTPAIKEKLKGFLYDFTDSLKDAAIKTEKEKINI